MFMILFKYCEKYIKKTKQWDWLLLSGNQLVDDFVPDACKAVEPSPMGLLIDAFCNAGLLEFTKNL